MYSICFLEYGPALPKHLKSHKTRGHGDFSSEEERYNKKYDGKLRSDRESTGKSRKFKPTNEKIFITVNNDNNNNDDGNIDVVEETTEDEDDDSSTATSDEGLDQM